MKTGESYEIADELLDEALNLVERLDAIIDNTLADDELVMAAWKVARQIDRLPHSTKPEPKPETQGVGDKPESAGGQEALAAAA